MHAASEAGILTAEGVGIRTLQVMVMEGITGSAKGIQQTVVKIKLNINFFEIRDGITE
jgi:hypothetical protein